MDKLYIIYDWRALSNVDKATVYRTENSLKKAIESAKDYGGGVIYSYNIKGKKLVNEKFEISVRGI